MNKDFGKTYQVPIGFAALVDPTIPANYYGAKHYKQGTNLLLAYL